MSELRQRRGDKDEADAQTKLKDTLTEVLEEKARREGKENPEEISKQVAQDLASYLEKSQKKVLPGITNKTKAAKDKLADDPYNLVYIFELGMAYFDEDKFKEATNVMIRGFKRMSELPDAESRFEYLYYLCFGSFKCQKYKQADAVLMDMEEPEDPDNLKHYLVLACMVHCYNDSLQKALKVFHRGLEACGDNEDQALQFWGQTYGPLKKVNAYDAAKSAIDRVVTNEEAKGKLEAIDKFGEIADQMEQDWEERHNKPILRVLSIMFLLGLLCAIIYGLYLLEARSLKSMKMKK
mmetsp:Transcript_40662/g.71558  ORF Transcript_40662/g.71558 Transcript_40662/m.71558 type:complete len:295 (-) Transcript_40662:84-968(-)